jgi:hypothetical protein
MEGIIYDSTPLSGDAKSIKKNYCKDIEFITELDHLKDIERKICKIEGSWLDKLIIDQKIYWDVNKDVP